MIGKAIIHSETSSGDSVMHLRAPLLILIAVCSPNGQQRLHSRIQHGVDRQDTPWPLVLLEIASILNVASKKEVLHHMFQGHLLQVYVAFSLCMLKLVDKMCRRQEIIYPVMTSWWRQAVSQYCSICSKVFGPVDRNCFNSAAELHDKLA